MQESVLSSPRVGTDQPPESRLDPDTPDKQRLSVAEAAELAVGALSRIGYSAEEAAIISEHLVDSALCGYAFAGLPRILAIASNSRSRMPRTPIKVIQESPASALLDGGNNVGYLAAYRGAQLAIEKSRFCGLAVVGVNNSYYSGRGAFYVEKMVEAGLVAIHTASAQPKVLPPGAAEPILGTNPMCFGFPSTDGPVIFDMGTAAMMGGELSFQALLGALLPEGLAFDMSGNPTRDPREALQGGVVPFGGHKGYGLSLSVQALGVLAGAALARGRVRDYSFFFLAIRPDVLLPANVFEEQMAVMVKEVKEARRQPGVDEIRVPFERARRERERRRVEGIVLDRTIVDAIRAL